MKPAVRLALYEAVDDSMGIYPASVNDVPRTPWQEGWNAYSLELSRRKCAAAAWLDGLPDGKRQVVDEMLEGEALQVGFHDGNVVLSFLSGDLFAWGYADSEEVTSDEMLMELHAAWKAKGYPGMMIWLCKKVGMQPQWPVERTWRLNGLWEPELDTLKPCSYDVQIGRWKDVPKERAVEELIHPRAGQDGQNP